MPDAPCPFCEIAAGRAPAEIVWDWDDAMAIVPRGPVVPGHTLVIPKTHVADFAENPAVSAATMLRAADLADRLLSGAMNLITSRGRAATQSVWHLHLHLVPRTENDGLALPWYSGRTRKGAVVEAHPPLHRWRVETLDSDQWVPMGSLRSDSETAHKARAAFDTSHPLWADETPVQRRVVRETTTYTVEPEQQ